MAFDARAAAQAHGQVGRAVKKGTLTKKPCEKCSGTLRVQAHHNDYSKPLDVVWLCKRCHERQHMLLAGKSLNEPSTEDGTAQFADFIERCGGQKATAKKFKCSPQFISLIATGKRPVPDYMLRKFGLKRTIIVEQKPC